MVLFTYKAYQKLWNDTGTIKDSYLKTKSMYI